MEYVKKTLSTVSNLYREMNPATLSGAIDVLVIRNEAGDLVCSPFHVRIGKLKVLRTADIRVMIRINGDPVDLFMKVGEAGEGFFVVETTKPVPLEIQTSPIQSAQTAFPIEVPPLQLDQSVPEGLPEVAHTPSPSIPIVSSSTSLRSEDSDAYQELSRFGSAMEEFPLDSGLSPSASGMLATSPPSDSLLATSPPDHSSWSWTWGGLPTKGVPESPSPTDPLAGSPDTVGPVEPPGSIVSMDAAGDPDLPLLPLSSARCSDWTHKYHIALSLCYSDLRPAHDAEEAEALFTKHEVKFEDLCDNPWVLQHPNLAVRIDGHFFRWSVAAPFVASLAVFGMPITREAFKALVDGAAGAPTTATNSNIPPPLGKGVTNSSTSSASGSQSSRWFSFFGGKKDANSNAPPNTVPPKSASAPPRKEDSTDKAPQQVERSWSTDLEQGTSAPIDVASAPVSLSSLASPSILDSPSSAALASSPPSSAALASSSSAALASSSSAALASSSSAALASSPPTSSTSLPLSSSPLATKPVVPEQLHYAKAVRLTSEQLKALPLKDGPNSIEFIISGNPKGEPACRATIYLWNHDVKVVISDIDGTITKSDVMGHLLTAVGRDWTHSGVANLYSNIVKNGYKIIYVTSRAIGQSNYTKEFLKWVEQSGGWRLPDGPCICAPDRLLAAFTREVIQKRPQEFKIAVLRDISNLFPQRTPFYAGFGNRITDAESYRAVHVPIQRIFTINPKGDIRLELAETYKSTYIGLNDIVDQMFPPLTSKARVLDEQFNDFNYWRAPLPEMHIDILDDEADIEAGDDDNEQTGGYPFYGLA